MAAWKTVGAAVKGPDHEINGLPCQDAFCVEVRGERLVAAVADGAGSAPLSQDGSTRLTKTVVEAMSAVDAALPADENDTAALDLWRTKAEAVIEQVRDEFTARASQRLKDGDAARLNDYGATLVAAIAEPDGGLFLHIGDGAGAALGVTGDWANATISRPENGEFANETYFFTSANWRDHLRLLPFGASALILLVSDGAMPFTLAEKFQGLEPRFVAPVTAYLDRVDPNQGRTALAATLDRDDARAINGDDKTVLWLRWF